MAPLISYYICLNTIQLDSMLSSNLVYQSFSRFKIIVSKLANNAIEIKILIGIYLHSNIS